VVNNWTLALDYDILKCFVCKAIDCANFRLLGGLHWFNFDAFVFDDCSLNKDKVILIVVLECLLMGYRSMRKSISLRQSSH